MKISRRITSRLVDAATTSAAYSVIGLEVVGSNITRENARKLMSTTGNAARTTGRVAITTGRVTAHTARSIRDAIHRRKVEIQTRDEDTIPY